MEIILGFVRQFFYNQKNAKLTPRQNVCSETKIWKYRYFASFIKSIFEASYPILIFVWKMCEEKIFSGWGIEKNIHLDLPKLRENSLFILILYSF